MRNGVIAAAVSLGTIGSAVLLAAPAQADTCKAVGSTTYCAGDYSDASGEGYHAGYSGSPFPVSSVDERVLTSPSSPDAGPLSELVIETRAGEFSSSLSDEGGGGAAFTSVDAQTPTSDTRYGHGEASGPHGSSETYDQVSVVDKHPGPNTTITVGESNPGSGGGTTYYVQDNRTVVSVLVPPGV